MSLGRSMPNDNQIAAMVEIAQSAGSALTKKRNRCPDQGGLVERSLEKYGLTPAGQKVLDDRGVGANEA